MNILFLCGSFRQGSYNQALLDSAAHYLQEHLQEHLQGHQHHQFAIEQLPFYSDALDGNHRPEVVKQFLQAVSDADAILMATPEFNHSIPAVLKNAIDWASRPAFNSPLKGKPVTFLSASKSAHGGNLLQAHLKQVLDSTVSCIYPSVSYCLGMAHEKIIDGELVDNQAKERLKRHISGFVQWAGQVPPI